jgi:hypothetical protein
MAGIIRRRNETVRCLGSCGPAHGVRAGRNARQRLTHNGRGLAGAIATQQLPERCARSSDIVELASLT